MFNAKMSDGASVVVFDNGSGFSQVVRPGELQLHFGADGKLIASTERGLTVHHNSSCFSIAQLSQETDWYGALFFGGSIVFACVVSVLFHIS
jgi:hypothetical protein